MIYYIILCDITIYHDLSYYTSSARSGSKRRADSGRKGPRTGSVAVGPPIMIVIIIITLLLLLLLLLLIMISNTNNTNNNINDNDNNPRTGSVAVGPPLDAIHTTYVYIYIYIYNFYNLLRQQDICVYIFIHTIHTNIYIYIYIYTHKQLCVLLRTTSHRRRHEETGGRSQCGRGPHNQFDGALLYFLSEHPRSYVFSAGIDIWPRAK